MMKSLLIANRGEIACRIIRTARRLGIRTVAVFSDADAKAPHVHLADRAVHIGPAPARDSYLQMETIISAARNAGADAIHPGYGFLSEKPELPRACAEAGLIWVGPNPDAIEAMGDKIRAKALAEAAAVPVVPGYAGDDQSPDALRAEALKIGLPVMVKASAGGGGKGMRAVMEDTELAAAIEGAKAEAERAFGYGRLLIEKLIRSPRHVEVQVLGDKQGTVVHLFERDCSVQRHHQKLLEEAPAPNLKPETRDALHRHAVTLASRIGYDNAGTAEFILDGATQDFFFLEMNTRLQVEHTVTEEITGLDLVEWQLRVAAGEALPFAQDAITATGHAIEARLTAEDATSGFRPDTGRILTWQAPAALRTDAGVETGSEISPHYDSMIAKLIAHGSDRRTAIAKLIKGLEDLTVLGPVTNRAFLIDALNQPVFHRGQATTQFIGETWPNGWSPPPAEGTLPPEALSALGACLFDQRAAQEAQPASPWTSLRGFRVLETAGRPAVLSYLVSAGGALLGTIRLEQRGSRFDLHDGEASWQVDACLEDGQKLDVTHAGVTSRYAIARAEGIVHLSGPGLESRLSAVFLGDVRAEGPGGAVSGDAVRAPMPGLIAEIRVAEGDAITAGQTVAVLESMKLLTELKAPVAGTVDRIPVSAGETVEAGALLVAIDPA